MEAGEVIFKKEKNSGVLPPFSNYYCYQIRLNLKMYWNYCFKDTN
jgi:hypothetical protein